MYEIYAYGDNDSLFGIFNAIAAITASDSYLGAVAIVAVCGFVTAAIAYALAPERLVVEMVGSVSSTPSCFRAQGDHRYRRQAGYAAGQWWATPRCRDLRISPASSAMR